MTHPPAIYDTEIGHLRRSPVEYGFRHRSASWYIDLDAPPTVPRWLRPLVSFRAADHLSPVADGADTLRGRVEQALRDHGTDPPGGRITALLNARCLGYVFDPLTVFWCHDAEGAVRAIVAEVHNTYSDRYAYVLGPSALSGASVAKAFYVSPFNQVDGVYRLRTPEPGDELSIDIELERPGSALFTAQWRGIRRAPTPARILLSQLRAPLVPLVVAARIRLHGVRLWAAGLPLVPRPDSTDQKAHP